MAWLLYAAGGLSLAAAVVRVLWRSPSTGEARSYGGVDAESWVLSVLCLGGVLLIMWAGHS